MRLKSTKLATEILISYEILDHQAEAEIECPSDIDESDLMEMLTEVMSIGLLNKNPQKFADKVD